MIKFAYFCAAASRINANSRNIVVLDNNETAVTEVIDPKEEREDGEEEKGGQRLGLFAVVFLWRAIWDWSEIYFTSNGSFIIGLILVGIVAFLNREHVKELF